MVSFEDQVSSVGSERIDLISHSIVHCKSPYLSIIKWDTYQSFFKSIKHTVCTLKLKHHWMSKKKKFSETVDSQQMTLKGSFCSKNLIFVEAQHELYPKDPTAWRNNKPLPKTIILLPLLPFLLYNLPREWVRIGPSFLLFKASNDATKKSPNISTFRHKMLMSETTPQERF